MGVKIHKLIEKKFLGYRCITNDMVCFETDAERGTLTIDGMVQEITLDLTPHTIEMLSEFIRYIKTDQDSKNVEK